MNAIDLTEEMELSRWKVPAWMKLCFYVALGALTWQGAKLTYAEVTKMITKAKYSYVSGVVADELDGKSFRLSPDLRDNKLHQYGDLTPPQMSMAIWTLSHELSQCESLRATVHDMTTGIEIVR